MRKAIGRTYTGRCTVIERKDVRDERTKITQKDAEVVVIEQQPCRLSFETIQPTRSTPTAATIEQRIKLFLAPELKIKGGSKIIVEQNGRKNEYCASGEPAIYPSHQELKLELFRRWG